MTKITDIDIPSFSLLKEKYKGKEFDRVVKLIENDYPVQYLIGDVPFLNATIKVDERALIPRPETELLVTKVNELIKDKTTNILDLCTGSGAIIISLLTGEGKGYPLQYSGLENSIDCIVHGIAKSQTRLSNSHYFT